MTDNIYKYLQIFFSCTSNIGWDVDFWCSENKRKMESTISPWSQLHQDLLGLVIARLLFPGDRARFRAVCRSWHMAVFEHALARR
jgi:hypothetical protein